MAGMNELALSVGVPTYNQCGLLRDTLVSLLQQDLPPLEIVVSDNHSTDETRAVLDEFREQVKVISPPDHLGMMEHWNYLADALRGEWFSLLSSDDEARPNFVRTLARGISRHPTAVLVRSGWENIDGEGRVLDQRYLLSVHRRVRPPNTFRENLTGPKTSFAAFAVRKRAWKAAGGFPTECKVYGDWAFWLRLSPLGDYVYEREIIARYRTNYRAGLELARLGDELADEEIISTRVIPDVRRAFGGISDSTVRRAIRMHFLTRLARLCELIPPFERDEVALAMQKWAEAADCARELERFRRGEQVVRRPRRPSAYARPIANAIRWPWV